MARVTESEGIQGSDPGSLEAAPVAEAVDTTEASVVAEAIDTAETPAVAEAAETTQAPAVAEPANTAQASATAEPADTAHAPAAAAEPITTTLALEAECMVAEAGTLKERLATLLDEPQPVTLDVAALQRIDTASLQVITAFIRERADAGRTVEWQGTAPVLHTAAQLLGLTSLLKLPA